MVKLQKILLKKETYVDKIVEIVEYQITTGKLKPNDKISELSLSKEFKVSRIPVREALSRLEEMGLVSKTNAGRVVKEFSIDEFRENYELKIIVEAYCCMEGAYKASDQEILNIKKILEKTRILLSSENHKDRLILNSRFHDCLVQCSRNNKLIEIYKAQTKKFGWPKFFPSIKLPRAQKSYKDHVKIFEAFAGGDGKMVRELAEEHQKSALEIMLANLRKNTNE